MNRNLMKKEKKRGWSLWELGVANALAGDVYYEVEYPTKKHRPARPRHKSLLDEHNGVNLPAFNRAARFADNPQLSYSDAAIGKISKQWLKSTKKSGI